MSVMAARLLTRAELDALPDDGLRHELIDGAFILTPSPGVPHQLMVGGLYLALRRATEGTDLTVLVAPLDVILGDNVVVPDLLVAPRAAFTACDLPGPPLLAVEVRSPTTAWIDAGRKRELYREHAVAHYWLVDPMEPSITCLELMDGGYVEQVRSVGAGAVHIARPFAITVDPVELGRG